MAKKTTKRKSTPSKAADHNDSTPDVLPEVCKIKHDVIDREFQSVKDGEAKRHLEIKKMIESLEDSIKEDVKESHTNLKDKIVLTEKTIGDKIDSLSAFDDTLKGNGSPGVWESIRSLNKTVKIIMSILMIIVIFELGGSWSKINWESLRERIWGSPETKQVEEVKTKEVESKEVKKEEVVPEEIAPKEVDKGPAFEPIPE